MSVNIQMFLSTDCSGAYWYHQVHVTWSESGKRKCLHMLSWPVNQVSNNFWLLLHDYLAIISIVGKKQCRTSQKRMTKSGELTWMMMPAMCMWRVFCIKAYSKYNYFRTRRDTYNVDAGEIILMMMFWKQSSVFIDCIISNTETCLSRKKLALQKQGT